MRAGADRLAHDRDLAGGAARDARALLAHALGCDPGLLFLDRDRPVTGAEAARFGAYLDRRMAREPVSHILGYRLFWGRRFEVGLAVLDPRPETECLIEAALTRPAKTVLDLGTGSGAILLTLLAEWSGARGFGTDISAAALAVARTNAQALGLEAEFRQGDWFDAVTGRFDLIVSNPPYIAANEMAALAPELRYDPPLALTPGGDGLGGYRAILARAHDHLAPSGRILLEIGPTQAAAVTSMAAPLGTVSVLPDLDGRDRVVCIETG
ncbi:MAG: peptide chain release factor N(5)-glutamine methyltransferase [Pseudomonadota bacterium]